LIILNQSIMSMDHSSHGSHSGHDSNMPMMMMPNNEIETTESTSSLHSNHVGAMSGMKVIAVIVIESVIFCICISTLEWMRPFCFMGGIQAPSVALLDPWEYLFRRSLSSIKYSSTSNSSTSNQPVQYYDEILLPSPLAVNYSKNAHPEPKSLDTNAASHHSVHNIVLSYVNIHDIQCMVMFSVNPRGWSRIFLIWVEEICRRRRDRTLSLTTDNYVRDNY
ncbi:hypothetical protein Anas_03191, partial [Armadillidium nasatum]